MTTMKQKWEAVPVAIKWTVSAVTVILAVVGYLSTYQSDAEAQQAHDDLKQEVVKTKITLEEAYKNDRIDRHEREIFRWEEVIAEKDADGTLTEVQHLKYQRRIDKLNATIKCIREETC